MIDQAEIQMAAGTDGRGPTEARGVQSPRVAAFLAYWERKRADRAMPLRADIDPGEMRTLLPYVALAEIHADPLRVRFRLAGEAIVQAHDCAMRGRWLADLAPRGGVLAWTRQYARLLAERAPVVGRLKGVSATKSIAVEWAICPLSSDGERLDLCLLIEDWKGVQREPERLVELTWTIEGDEP